jgi:acetyl-CoA carboxylase biotin carboxyl carrier protein
VTLTAKDVAEITRLLEESSFDELYLEIDGLKLSLKRGVGANGQAVAAPGPASSVAQPPGADPTAAAASTATAAAAEPAALQDIRAPLLGTFYRAPKPGAPPFVEVGSVVEEDTIIGILEVMKLMNTIRAGLRGKITQVLARDGTLVEYGEPLMRVSVSEPDSETSARG